MKKIEECKEYYKHLYIDCLAYDGFTKSSYESMEKARFEMLCETLAFVYGSEFKKIERFWQREALKEFYK